MPAAISTPIPLHERLQSPVVSRAIDRAVFQARSSLAAAGVRLESEELRQDGFELILARADLRECVLDDTKVFWLTARLRSDLIDRYKGHEGTRSRVESTSIDQALELQEEGFVTPLYRPRTASPDHGDRYTESALLAALLSVWDDSWSASRQLASAPATGMPRGATPSSGWWAETLAIDVKLAWERAHLSTAQRAVLMVQYGLDESRASTARILGMTQQQVASLARSGKTELARAANQLDGRHVEVVRTSSAQNAA